MNFNSIFSKQTIQALLFVAFSFMMEPVSANGAEDYRKTAYPIITLVGGTIIILLSYYISFTSRKNTNGVVNEPVARHSMLFAGFLFFLYMCGIFLAFGPDTAPGNAAAEANPRAAVIGLQLLLQVAVGVYLMFHPSPIITDLYIIFSLFNILALIGSNTFFNYNFPIWTLDEFNCNAYFDGTSNPTSTFTRCDDDGYLQFLRIMGHFTILIVLASVVYAISRAFELGHQLFAHYGSTAAGAPVGTTGAVPATSYPASSYPAKDVATTAGPTTSVPVNY